MEAGKRKREGDDEDYEDSKPSPTKTKKPARRKGKKRVLEDVSCSSGPLPLDALALVMEFLSPRQLFNVAFTCQTLLGRVTTRMVIRSGLIHGGHAKQTLQELHQPMSHKSIHVPSCIRLLRLVNGKRCEFCCRSSVNHVRPGLGVFACWSCVTDAGLTKPWKLTWARYRKNEEQYDAILDHPRVATNLYGPKAYLWSCPRNVPLSGERIGPLVAFDDVDRMFQHTQQKGKTVDSYLAERILAPPEESYQEFNDAYAETIQHAKRVEREREQKKAAAKEKAKDSKRAKIDKMVADLAKLMPDPYRDVSSTVWKKKDLGYGFRTTGLSKLPTVEFVVPFVNDLLKPYVITPSKIRKKILADIAATIHSKLSLISSRNFLSLEFLSEDDPFEGALKSHFRPILTNMDSLLETKVTEEDRSYHTHTTKPITDEFFGLLEKNQLVNALVHLKQRDLSCLLLAATNTATKNEKAMARTVWFEKLEEEKNKLAAKKKEKDDRVFRDAFFASQAVLPKALSTLEGYVAWLDKKYPEDVERREYARDRACENGSRLPLLLEEKYEELDKEQDGGFQTYIWHKWR